jgi:uncharacterized protein YoxC
VKVKRSEKMLIKLSVAGASGAFIFLAVNLVGTLKKGMVTLDETNRTLAEVRNAVNGLTEEAEQLIQLIRLPLM